MKNLGRYSEDLSIPRKKDVEEKYTMPTGGIPKSDLSSSVQSSLGKAETALQTAPVTSVNGATGEVKSTFYVTVTQGDDDNATADKTAEEVYAAHAAGYAVYAIAKFPALTPLPFALPLVVAMSVGGTLQLGFAALGSINSASAPMYPTVAYSGTSGEWLAWLGTLARASDPPNLDPLNIKIGNTTTSYDGSVSVNVKIPEGVPSVTAADNGKFLRVVNGAWAAVEIANANGGSF